MGGWRWTSHSPTGSGPEGSSPNERGSGRSSASHLLFERRATARGPRRDRQADGRMSETTKPVERGLDFGAAPEGTSYCVLARKYRPADFNDLIGQDAMVRTISNAFESKRIPQAWILTGVRGVGKTTTARILTRALNYELPGKADKPTLDMQELGVHCQAIMESRHVDVMEMDGASNTGIDDIREIIEAVRYKPAAARM